MLLTREATQRRVTAVAAGALLAVAPFAVRYSQENRYYVMFSALALLSWWLVLRALRLRRTSAWVWYGIGAAAMQLTHPFAPLVLVIQAALVGVMFWRDGKTVKRQASGAGLRPLGADRGRADRALVRVRSEHRGSRTRSTGSPTR